MQRHILLSNILVTLWGSRILNHLPNSSTSSSQRLLPRAEAPLGPAGLPEEPAKAKHKTKAAPKKENNEVKPQYEEHSINQQSNKACNISKRAMHERYNKDSSAVSRVHNGSAMKIESSISGHNACGNMGAQSFHMQYQQHKSQSSTQLVPFMLTEGGSYQKNLKADTNLLAGSRMYVSYPTPFIFIFKSACCYYPSSDQIRYQEESVQDAMHVCKTESAYNIHHNQT
ncbi:hypothetical protein F511_20675 [Dorcoceras hygrometricum]|uniref:Uncharacterized protein n=1 Tax=Dorcoceras hygrometricum TaxID=472368 RepID=A0A2Z7BWM9_9LAMI|nr:hypothetical protein F511_20675 [Dorcoceras hygrometricum]